MNKKHLLALVAVSVFSGSALADMVTLDAGNYSFSYDDDFWVGGASKSGDTFTFTNLVSYLGTGSTTASHLPYTQRSDGYVARHGWLPSITVTADEGYRVKSVASSGNGYIAGDAGADTANVIGSEAVAFADMSTYWYNDTGGGHDSLGGSFANMYYQRNRNSAGLVDNVIGAYGAYNMSATKSFEAGVTAVSGYFLSTGWSHASGKGSWAMATLENVSFSVAVGSVSAVPEPETWAMFLAGLGVLGAARRRQSRTSRQ